LTRPKQKSIAPNAIKHYKTGPLGKAQLILATNVGHSPMMECLNDDERKCDESKVNLFMTAVQGPLLTKSAVGAFNSGKSKWVITSRWGN
jgi:hypothetical protein